MRKIYLVFLVLTIPIFLKAQEDSFPSVSRLAGLTLEELMDIKVVTASGYLQTTSEAPSTITVITAQQITERGYQQLEDALRNIPGIDMIHINGYAPTLIYFRGMYGAENLRALLMIDGIVENNILGSNDMAGPAYSLHNVERIEIIWGPASALYGANAFGGVINIITKKGAAINGVQAELGYGSFNTSTAKFNLGLKRSKFEFAVAGSLYNSDGPVFKNRDPQYTGSFVDKAYSINTTLSYLTKTTKTSFGYRTYRTPIGWGTYANSPTVYLGLPPQGNQNAGVIGVVQRDIRGERPGVDDVYLRTLFVQNEFTPNKKFNLLSRFVYRETGVADNSYIYITVDGTKLIRAGIASTSNRVAGELAANFAASEMHKFSAGIQYSQDNVEKGARKATFDSTIYLMDGTDTLTNLKSVYLPREYDIRNNFGGYLQYALSTKLLGKTNLTIGGRYDHNSYFGDALSPRVSLVNQPIEALTFKFQFGYAFRAPSNLEIYQTGLNFELKTEKIKAYEFNVIYVFSKKFRTQVNLFRNELTDIISQITLPGPNPNKNPGAQTINGLEAIIDMVLSKNISSFANFTYQDANGKNYVTNIKGRIPGIAKAKGNAGVTMHIDKLFTFSLIGNWVGERRAPRTDPYGPVKGYFLMNCELSTGKLFNKGITVGININNLFNATWLDPGFRSADGVLYSTVLEQPGRNGLLKVGISL